MKYCVYLIITNRNNKYISYVGYTKDLKKRLELHNTSKGAKFTRGSKWTVIYKKYFNSQSLALKEEYNLKSNKEKRKLIKYKYIDKIKKK